MAQEKTTIARPYAEAVFSRAAETDTLDLWSEALAYLNEIVTFPDIADLIVHPKLSREQVGDLLLKVAGDRLNTEGQNLIKLLAANDRLEIVPEIVLVYEQLRHERQGKIPVRISSAFALQKAQEKALADVLKARLGRDVEITTEKDPTLIGGILIRAGDLVIDGSVRGQLNKLANELRI